MHGGRGTLLLVYFFFVKFLDFENSDSRRFVSALVAFWSRESVKLDRLQNAEMVV